MSDVANSGRTVGESQQSQHPGESLEEETARVADRPRSNSPDGRRRGRMRALRQILGRRAIAVSSWGEWFCKNWRWLPTAAALGAVPILLSIASNIPGHQFVTAVLLAILCLNCVRNDRWLAGVGLIAVTFIAHSAVAILCAMHAPQRASALMPDAEDYWDKQVVWIETGQDPEYELANWVPAHAQLAAGSTLCTFTSLGVITFYEGFHQVDMMNFYNGRLLLRSTDSRRSLGWGWHLWSLLRGVGYVFLTLEVMSLALQLLTQQKLSSGRTRCLRWSLGLGFLLGDCAFKLVMLGFVRDQLFQNLA